MEEDAYSFPKPHLVQQQYINAQFQANPSNRGISCSQFFFKFLLIAFFLSLLPLFPSEPPEFISNTVFAKSWELIHLLIIGIALSYGLFCRPKAPQVPPKPQISQPDASNILHHSSIFDYEEGNPSGVTDKNAIPTQSFNLSHYRTEPCVVPRRENCKDFDERPLGLPVRSLRSRVVESDSEEDDEEEVCASECDSDLNGSSSSSTSEKDEKDLEGKMGNSSPMLCKSQSMRRDFFMAENGKFEDKQSYFEPFRSPVPAAPSCQNFSGFCSWLPESPNIGRENCWRENNFYMPFYNFNQVNDFNLVGISPNFQNTANSYMPPAAVHPSMPFSAADFALNSRKYNHENEHWGNANFENENCSVEDSGFFMASAAGPPSMSIPASDFGSRSREHNHETEIRNKSSNLQNETLGGGTPNLFMPSVAFSPSMPAFADNYDSSLKASKNAEFNQGSFLRKKEEMGSENNSATVGVQNTNIFMPSAAVSPTMSVSAHDSASPAKASNNSKFDHVSSLKKKDEMRSENNNVALSRENTNIFMPSAAFSPSMSVSTDDAASSVKASKDSKFNHVSSVKKKDRMRSENNNVALGRETAQVTASVNDSVTSVKASNNSKFNRVPSVKKKDAMMSENNNVALGRENTQMTASANDSATSVKASKNSKLNRVSSVKKKDEMISENNNEALGRENTQIFMPSAAFSPSMPASTDDSASSVKASKDSKFNRVSSVKKKDEMRSENNNVPLGRENTQISMPSTAFSPSMPASTDDLASSVEESNNSKFNHECSLKKKDEMSSKGSNVVVGSFQEETNSCPPPSDLLSCGKSQKSDNGNSGDGITNFFKNTAEVLPSVPYPVDQFASSLKASRSTTFNHKACVKKDQERSKKENAESFREKDNSNTSHFVDPISFPSSRVDILKKNEQNSIPERWGDDCFVIPSLENNDVGDILLENLSSSEAPSSAGPSSRRSSHEQGSPWNKANEHVPRSTQINNSEIENVTDDVAGESDSYKPSTPSPPPRVQARVIDQVASSVESSSRALGNQSFLKNDDDDDDQGSPPTPERRKPLSRVSHSRRFSCGSFFDRDLRKSIKEEAKEANKKTKGDDDQFPRGGMCGWDCLKLDVKPAFNKAALKGKSVRTVRPKEIAQDRQKNDHLELKCGENNEGFAVANGGESKGEKSEMMVIKIGISEKRSNSSGRKREKLQGNGGTTSILLGLNSKQNSNGITAVHDDVKEENDGEIDRKADEFIAKFKEQIRLQKVAPRSVSSRQHKNSL